MREMIRQQLAVDQLEHEIPRAVRFLEAVDGGDVRMIQRREDLRLAFEAREAIGVFRERFGKNLERDRASEFEIPGAIDLAHASGAERRDDFVRAETVARGKGHPKADAIRKAW